MMVFLKQYGIWYVFYVILVASLLVSFWLYHIPLDYFKMALLFSGTLLLLLSAWQFWQFKKEQDIIAFYQDISELVELDRPRDVLYQKRLRQLEDDYKDSIFAIESQQKQQQELVKLWSHQMKIPLSVLSLMVQTNQLSKEEVSQQLLRLENYLGILLNYLKFSGERDDFRFESLSVDQVIRELIKKYRLVFIHKKISLTVSGDWELTTDKKWLTFALAQILDNALKYTQESGNITIEMMDNSISISDTGIGILSEDIPRLFEDGFTGYNGHEHQKASGFGLYMTKQVLDRLELSIEVYSQVEKGTTVRVFK